MLTVKSLGVAVPPPALFTRNTTLTNAGKLPVVPAPHVDVAYPPARPVAVEFVGGDGEGDDGDEEVANGGADGEGEV